MMNRFWAFLGFAAIIFSSAAFADRPSKCVVKLRFKVEREGNRQYLWCLDDWEEDGEDFFYTTRRFVEKGVSEIECEQMAKNTIGERMNLKFIAAPPLGMVGPMMETDPYECEGTAVAIRKLRYRPARY